MPDTSLEYRDKFLKRQLQQSKKFRLIFNKAAYEAAQLSNDPSMRLSKAFKFPPVINKKITAIIADFQAQALALTEKEIEYSWKLSNSKNDEIVSGYLKTITTIKTIQKAKYFLPNTSALEAFISGKHGIGTLSDAVWKVSTQLRSELETQLGIGVLQGDSAPVISRRIRQYLNNPDALFRRVRDNKGRLVASQKMIEFRKANNLTQGTYTSAYKNALRVARTNTNQAYLLADHIRWAQMDIVIGVEISLSAQHKIYDICDECEGTYPKDFVFVGWHPSCLCHAVAILMPESDFKAYLKGNKPLKAEQITDYSPNFKSYVKDNYERYSNYKKLPFWIEDNAEIIKDILKK